MGGFISKQPNGKYCRFSGVVDCPTHINMEFDDYVYVVMDMQGRNYETAKREAQKVFSYYLRPFEQVIRSYIPNNMSQKTFLETVKRMCDPNGVYEEIGNETNEIIKYDTEEELNTELKTLKDEAREIAGLGPRK